MVALKSVGALLLVKLVIVPLASCVTLVHEAGKHPNQVLYCHLCITSLSDEKLSSRVTNTASVGRHCRAALPSLRVEVFRSRYIAWSWIYQLGKVLSGDVNLPSASFMQAGAPAIWHELRNAPFQPTMSKWWASVFFCV